MRPSSYLFDLIHSLDRNEKRYFKVYSSLHVKGKKNVYIKIFDTLDKLNTYDESKVKEVFRNERFINNFHVIKKYLYDLILKSLRNFYTDFTIESQILDLLRNIEILEKKRLLSHCSKQINKAKSLAVRYGQYHLLSKILEWDESINKNARIQLKIEVDEIDDIHREINLNLDKLYALNKQRSALNKVFYYKYNDMDIPLLLKSIETDIASVGDFSDDRYLQMMYLVGIANYYWTIEGDMRKALEYNKKAYSLLQDDIAYINAFTQAYEVIIFRILGLSAELKDQESFKEYLVKAKELPKQLYKKTAKFYLPYILFKTFQVQVADAVINKSHTRALQYLEEMKVNIETSDYKLSAFNTFIFKYMSMAVYFNGRKFETSLNYSEKIIASEYSISPNYKNLAHIVSLIIHYELGNLDLIGYRVRTTYNLLRKKNKLFRFERLILDFLRLKALKAKTKKQLLEAFIELKLDMSNILANPNNRDDITEWVDFEDWLGYTIHKIS